MTDESRPERARTTDLRAAAAGAIDDGVADRGPGVVVREATADEVTAVLNVLDGAALATDFDRIAATVERGDVLVAVPSNGPADGPGGVALGALVLDGPAIDSIAVRRNRRGQGIGSRLVAAAADRRDRLVATFRAEVRPFYERLGFEIEPIDVVGNAGSVDEPGRRSRGRLDADRFDRP